MQLTTLSQLNVRNLKTPTLHFDAGVMALVGRNAAGKSNVMDAAYLGCTGDVPAGTIAETVALGETEGWVAVEVLHSDGASRVDIGLAPGRKVVRLDGQHVRAADVARVSSAVLLTPEDADMVHGSPSRRRGYLDGLLGKLSPRYARLAREYSRVLEQRNALLRAGTRDAGLEVWTQRFALLGGEIDDLRERAVARVEALARAVYADVAADGKELGVRLARRFSDCALAAALEATRGEEMARGATVVGPHRDDLELTLDGHSVQAFGSRGEARTTALALRVAEYRLLAERHGEPPVLLVDDFTAELDAGRREFLLALTSATPQALVSGTEPPPRYDALFEVRDGTTRRV